MKVTAWSLRVRTESGSHVCSLPNGTNVQPIARDTSGTRVQVELSAKGCPTKGWVDMRYLRPSPSLSGFEEAETDIAGLSLRTAPEINGSTYKCALSAGARLEILPETKKGRTTTWLKVKTLNSDSKCQGEGWVSAAYLRPSLSIKKLPELKETDPRAKTEAEPCAVCETAKKTGQDAQLEELRKISEVVRDSEPGRSPFLNEILELSRTKKCQKESAYQCSRGLIQMPLIGRNAGFCGTHHYTPDSPTGVDAFANPMTACALTALAQEWRKTECPNLGGCRISWGDISHKTLPRYNGHITHTDGNCIDIRPMATGDFEDSGLTYNSQRYDREKTKKFIALAEKLGAQDVLFNDPKVGATSVPGHHNHIHLCFPDSKTTRDTCNNLKVDPNLCPEVQ